MVGHFNLIDARWLPVRRANGPIEWIAPWQLTEGLAEGTAFVSIAAPRPDFAGALLEFLIGLLATAASPVDDEAWDQWWRKPPSPRKLRTCFAAVADAFVLDGDVPRFMQDHGHLNADETRIEALLIDAPGENTRRRNADLFVKRNSIPFLSRAAAAMALFTLQTYAPFGGAGNRVSLRGGGPLTTLAQIQQKDRPPSLWDRLWPNVETKEQIEENAPSAASLRKPIFPWLNPTRTSDNDRETTPGDAHPLQAYWGMPRRIRLEFVKGDGQPCPLTGTVDRMVVRSYRTRPHGTHYGAGWRHPLSPYYRRTPNDPNLLPVHAPPDGVSYRHWLGLVMRDSNGRREPGRTVQTVLSRRVRHGDEVILSAFGYSMAQMKARAWIDSEMPLSVLDDAALRGAVQDAAETLIVASDEVAYALRAAVKSALFERPGDASGDFSGISERFWRTTEAEFYACLHQVKTLAAADPDNPDPARPARQAWLSTLRRHAFVIFDELAPSDPSELGRIERVVSARFDLAMSFHGYGALGRKLWHALKLPIPEVKSSARGRKPKEAQI